MILVDTSVWIDHLHEAEPALVHALMRDEVGHHPLVVEELAMGRLTSRIETITALRQLRPFPVVSHEEVLAVVDRHQWWGRGLTAVDAHILGSAMLVPGATLWTRDGRMRAAAAEVGQPLFAG